MSDKLKKRVTMQDIARAAKLSLAATSMALRDHPEIAITTRERVKAVAIELGYRPDPNVSKLMSLLSQNRKGKFRAAVGLMNLFTHPNLLSDDVPQWAETISNFAKGANDRADELGYKLDDFWLRDPSVQPARLNQILETRGIEGILVVGTQCYHELSPRWEPICKGRTVVLVGWDEPDLDFHSVSTDHFYHAKEATVQVLKCGYKKPVLLVDPTLEGILERRFTGGYLAAMTEIGLAPKIWSVDWRHPEQFNRYFVAGGARPDAIITHHRPIRDWLTAVGLKVPSDIGLAFLQVERPKAAWSGMNQQSFAVGRTAMDLLDREIRLHHVGMPSVKTSTFVRGIWNEGETLPRKRKRATAKLK